MRLTMSFRTANSELKNLFKILPKTELHAHFVSTLPLDFVNKINNYVKDGITIPQQYKNLTDFLNFYGKLYGRKELNEEELEEGSYLICMDAAKHNVKCIEIRFASILNPLPDDKICFALAKGIERAEANLNNKGFIQKAGIILSLVKTPKPYDKKLLLERLSILERIISEPQYKIVGLDIAGDEKIMSLDSEECQMYINLAKKHHIPLTIHAGEIKDDLSKRHIATHAIKNAIDSGAQRIGHGIHILEDTQIIELAREKNVCLETCPSSNIIIGHVPSWDALPIKKMLQKGLKVTINTDNQSLLHTNYSLEFERLYENGIITQWDDIKTLVLNGIESTFLDSKTQSYLLELYVKELEAIEDNPLFHKIISNYLS